VTFPRATLNRLPQEPSDGRHCFDVNGNGEINPMDECAGGHERVMQLPPQFRKEVDTPFQWVLMNWNPHGHVPPNVYTVPHFDFHFFIMDLEERDAIGPGPCGIVVDCDDFAAGRVPVPVDTVPKDYADVGAVEVAMGNHLVDLTAPEFNGRAFTHTFIYGAFAGAITFYEPMVTLRWFDGLHSGTIPSRCFGLKLPTTWSPPGWYPTEYCLRYRPNRDDYTVSLEQFVHRTGASLQESPVDG
jgi:hypothetical protein